MAYAGADAYQEADMNVEAEVLAKEQACEEYAIKISNAGLFWEG